MHINILKILFFLLLTMVYHTIRAQIRLPIEVPEKTNLNYITLTSIGGFGKWRNDRPDVPGHFHTGIDIERPNNNYTHEMIFPVADGLIISLRHDGPYAQIIIEHHLNNLVFWSVYGHISGIMADLGDQVNISKPIARFMNKEELNLYGWQFDHFHLELLKIKPFSLENNPKHPKRLYNTYSLICYSLQDLTYYYYDPIEFFKKYL